MDGRSLERGRDGPLTSLVFPAYNPGSVLDRTCPAVEDFLRTTADNWEVLFVCDGCTDGTPQRLQRWADELTERVRVLHYQPNRGKGHAVRHGLLAARGEWRLFMDVDLAYGFDDLRRVAAALHGGAAVAIASRAHPESQVTLPSQLQGYVYRRHLQSLAFSALVRLLLPLSQRDTQAGLKGLTAAAAWQVVPHLRCDGFGLDCELLTACVRYGLPVVEVPVCVRYEDRASTTNAVAMGRMVRELWRIRRAWRHAPGSMPIPAEPGQRRAA